MQFRFTRDEDGAERIHVGDVCVARIVDAGLGLFNPGRTVPGMRDVDILDAIERADEAGFWSPITDTDPRFTRRICGGVDEPWRDGEDQS